MGITEEQFWHMNPRKLKPYEKARVLREDEKNFNLWLQGLYNYNALCASISRCIGGDKQAEYIDEPIRTRPLTEEEQMEQVRIERERAIAFFNGMEGKAKAEQAK